MTTTDIVTRFNLQPKDVNDFIQANAKFYVKRNFQTGELTIPDDIDIEAFIAPLYEEKFGAEIAQKKQIEQEKWEKLAIAINNLKENGAQGYYEYKLVSIYDEQSGYVDVKKLTDNLNVLGLEGWHLVTAFSNELGRNTNTTGFGVFTSVTNATIDQNVLIFERFVKI